MADDDADAPPRLPLLGVVEPGATAVASLSLGLLSLGGFGLLNGANYVLPLTQGQSDTVRTLLAGLVGVLGALAALAFAVFARRRTHPGDPAWVSPLAQAAVLVASIAVVLRLVATAAAALQVAGSGYFAPL